MNEIFTFDRPPLPSISHNSNNSRSPQLGTAHSSKIREPAASINSQMLFVNNNSAPSAQSMKPSPPTHICPKPVDLDEASATAHAGDGAGAGSVLVSPSAKYARKTRHKTKADTYQYKGDAQTKTKSRKRKRVSGSLGNDSFRAANINAERVTLKPNSDRFVFSRSRKSLPLPGQDLPDLTFTKMNYLSQLPREVQPYSEQSTEQSTERERVEEYIVRRKQRESIARSAAAVTSNSQSLTSKSDLYWTRFATDNSQDTRVYRSRHEGSANDLCRATDESSWVKNAIDPRVEEFRVPDTDRHASAPVSWPTSPSRNAKRSAHADNMYREARSESDRNHIDMTRRPEQSGTGSTTDCPSQCNKDHYDELTRTLLRKAPDDQVAFSHQRVFKMYLSLEDLKRISRETCKESSTDCLEIHPRPWQSSLSGRIMSPSAPSPLRRPSIYPNDVIASHHDPRDLLFHIPIQQNRVLEACQSGIYDNVYETERHFRTHKVTRDSEQCTVSSHVPIPQPVFVMQGLQADHNSHGMVLLPPGRQLSYIDMLKPREVLTTVEHHIEHPASVNECLDAFDLELLETVKTTRLDHSCPPADCSRFRQTDNASFTDFTTQHTIPERNGKYFASFSVQSPAEQGLFQVQNAGTTWEEEHGLMLDRASLRRLESTQQDFNPFKRSLALL